MCKLLCEKITGSETWHSLLEQKLFIPPVIGSFQFLLLDFKDAYDVFWLYPSALPPFQFLPHLHTTVPCKFHILFC